MSIGDEVRKWIALVSKSLLFLSSYAPLGCILAVLLCSESRVVSLALLVIVALTVLLLYAFLQRLP